jgi:Protein of unknown function (DUF2970)
MSNNDKEPEKVSFLTVLQSTAAAAFGVQSQKNRERDFKNGKPIAFIAGGIIFALVFILSIYTVVQMVLP